MISGLQVVGPSEPSAGPAAATAPREAGQALRAVAASLRAALAGRAAGDVEQLLDALAGAAAESSRDQFCADSLAEACCCSGAAAEAGLGATTTLKALLSLTGLLQLYRQHGRPLEGQCQCPRELGVVPLAKQVSSGLRGCSEPAVLAAGLAALHALAACLAAGGAPADAGDMIDAVGASGVVEAAAAAVQQLLAAPYDAAAAAAAQQSVAQGLEVLHCVCAGHAGNLGRLAAAGGLPAVARAAELTGHPAGLALLAALGGREGAPAPDAQLAAAALLAAAQRGKHAQLQAAALQGLRRLPAGALPAEQLVSGLLPLLAAGRDAAEPGALPAHAAGLAAAAQAAAALPQPAQKELLEPLQAAAAALCSLLAKNPDAVHAAGAPALAAPELAPQAVPAEVLAAVVHGLVAVLGAAGPEGINTPDTDGCTLLHRLAASGAPAALEPLLSAPCSPPVDLLLRTPEGANALQLAGRSGCAALLEGATQAAAQQVADALLAELDEEAAQAAAGRKGGKPPAPQQPAGAGKPAAQPSRPASADSPLAAGDSLGSGLSDAVAAAVAAEEARRKELDEAYERALEERRRELEAQAAAAHEAAAAKEAHAPLPCQPQQPTSPQPQEGGPMLSAFAAAAEAGPMVSAFAAAAGVSASPPRGSPPQKPPQPPPQVQPQPQPAPAQQGARQTAFTYSGLDLSQAVAAPVPPPVQMAHAPSGELHPASPHLSAFSAFAAAAVGHTPFASGPAPSASPFSAPPPSAFAPAALEPLGSGALGHAPSGGLDGASPFARMTSGHLLGPALPPPAGLGLSPMPSAPPAVLPYPGDPAAARSFSSQLQDALFLGVPDYASPGSPPSTAARSALAAAAAAAQLRGVGTALPPHAGALPLAQRATSLPVQLAAAGRAGSAADEILNLLPGLGGVGVGVGVGGPAAEALARQASQGLGLAGLGPLPEGDAAKAAAPLPASDPDVSCEPTRHLWIGNLGTRTPRAVLKTIFEKYGVVDDVVTFPGRMYAFVNYRSLEEAVAAYDALQGQVVPELTGDRPLLLKFRPAKKAAAHLRALGLAAEEGAAPGGEAGLGALPGDAARPGGEAAACGAAGADGVDKDGNSLEPSPRIWLGNIAPTATSKSLTAVLSRFGPLTDAAVFPARIGPLGYAFVKFERLEDAVRAYEALNNTVVPPLSGSKQLKMRYKPPSDGPPGKDDGGDGSRVMVPSRHLWLGNVTQKPTDEAVLEVFAAFGKVDSVRVFPVKAYAFVNYAEIASAIKAMSALEGVAIPALTGVKPLVMRYQQEAVVAAAAGAAPKSAAPSPPGAAALARAGSDAAGLAAALAGAGTGVLQGLGLGGGEDGGVAGEEAGGLHSVPNLSNRLNPNNAHFDPSLAERYKALSRREKDMLWATDQLMAAHQMAAAQQVAAAAGSGPLPPDAQMMMRGMNRSHSWNISMLHNHITQHPNQPASGLSPALTAAAALDALRQQQAAAAAQQRQLAALQLLNNPGEPGVVAPAPQPQPAPYSQPMHSAEMQSYLQQHAAAVQQQQQHHHHHQQQQQQRSMFGGGLPAPPMQLAPQAPPHQACASPAQLSAVLSNLAALQQQAAGAASLQRAASVPHPGPTGGVHTHAPGAPFAGLDAGVLLGTYLHGVNGGAPPEPAAAAAAQGDVLAGLFPSSPPLSASPGLAATLSPAHHGGLGCPGGPGSPAGGPPPPAAIPDQLLCPLSGAVMLDPVVAADGVTYERKAIAEWLALRDTSPITHSPLPHKMLTPSMATKAALMDFLQRSSGVAL